LGQLTDDDASDLWDVAVTTILADAAALAREAGVNVFAEVGCCSHWIRPHQYRWIEGGGFASPFGYDKTTTGYSFRALPALDWSIFFRWTGSEWEWGSTGRRKLLLRIAVPARTARHLQAAIHTIWTPRSPVSKEKTVQLYGFRKDGSRWYLVAYR
jgi:hypothetical protein